jgi:DNA-binding CsgD family transcriptional regulator
MLALDIEYVQDVLAVYATLTNLNCIITDKDGNPVTPISGDANLFDLIYEYETLKEVLGQRAREFSNINGPVLFDTIPGVKVIICPIFLQGEIEFFVFAGCLLEESSRNSVQSFMEKILKNPGKATIILSFVREYSPEEIQAKIGKIKKLANLIMKWLSTQRLKERLIKQEENLHDICQRMAGDDLSVNELLQRFFQIHSKVDFVGYARKIGLDRYNIVECIESGSTLKGTAFSIGEGVLGQTVATKAFRLWDQLDYDPRSSFFHQRGIYPRSLFCFPIIQGQEVLGLFFGGSSQFRILEKEVGLEVKMTASLINLLENKIMSQLLVKDNSIKITALNEIFQVMTTVKDVKRILYIILDICLNLIRGKFVAVIIEQPSLDSFDIVSRGLTSEQIDDYSKDLVSRYFNNKKSYQSANLQPVEYITNWNTNVLEIPIAYNNERLGYLCIGLNNSTINEEELSFLKCFSKLGGLAIYLLEDTNKVEMEQTVIELLIELQQYIDPEHFKKSNKARKIIKGFSEYLSNRDLNTLAVKYACYFIGYDEQFLKDKIKNELIIDIVREYKLIEDNSISFSEATLNAQVLTLVLNYIESGENINVQSDISGNNHLLVNSFLSYLSNSTIIESTISLTKNKPVFNEANIISQLKVSKRELEVVKLVLQGKNNREIAESLFISEHTVKNHMTKIFHKLGVADRSQAIAKLYQTGFEPKDVS